MELIKILNFHKKSGKEYTKSNSTEKISSYANAMLEIYKLNMNKKIL